MTHIKQLNCANIATAPRIARRLGLAVFFATAIACWEASAATYFSGVFVDLEPEGPSPVFFGAGGSSIAWGDYHFGNTGPSGVSYFPYEVSPQSILSGAPFSAGWLVFQNGTIVVGTGIQGATLILTPHSDDPALAGLGASSHRMITESTPNTSDPVRSADYLFSPTYVPDDLGIAFFNIYEGTTAWADILLKLRMIPHDFNVTSLAVPAVPAYELVVVGFANVQGGGFLTDSPVANRPPDALGNGKRSITVWPPNLKLSRIDIKKWRQITDLDGDPVRIVVRSITQDEPITGLGRWNTSPDGYGIGLPVALVRAERDATGNGRVYHITFDAVDDKGASSFGEFTVNVPRNQGESAIDDGQNFDSTEAHTAQQTLDDLIFPSR